MKYGELLARKMVWLAYQASNPVGLGTLHYRTDITEETLWCSEDVVKQVRVKPVASWIGRIATVFGKRKSTTYVSCDYVFGRMMKLRFEFTDNDVLVDNSQSTHPAYQSWSAGYQTTQQLRHAAIHELYVDSCR